MSALVVIQARMGSSRLPGKVLEPLAGRPLLDFMLDEVKAFMVIGALPAIMVASTSLILDRLVGTHFFNPAEGGDVLLWQHLFWFFGHPEVYIIFIPGTGIVSTIIALARSYDLDTVAEGVETAAQLEILAALGCEISQGYLHSPAVPAETIEALLRAGPDAAAQRENQ